MRTHFNSKKCKFLFRIFKYFIFRARVSELILIPGPCGRCSPLNHTPTHPHSEIAQGPTWWKCTLSLSHTLPLKWNSIPSPRYILYCHCVSSCAGGLYTYACVRCARVGACVRSWVHLCVFSATSIVLLMHLRCVYPVNIIPFTNDRLLFLFKRKNIVTDWLFWEQFKEILSISLFLTISLQIVIVFATPYYAKIFPKQRWIEKQYKK